MSAKLTETRNIQAYQCDRFGNMRPLVLMNILQGMGDTHAEKLGVGYSYCESHGIAWVVTHYLVDIIEMPQEREQLQITTWPSVSDNLRTSRDFEIRGMDGRLMVRATSQWILIDLNTRRPLRLADHLPEFESLSERAWDRTFDKFPDFTATKTHVMKCRFDDIDVNQHINNAVYAVWATESVGFEFRSTHQLTGIELNFKKEVSPSVPEVSIDVAFDGNVTRHRIRTGDTEHAIVVCTWKELNK